MSRKYKFHNKQGLYFVSFAVAYWVDVFTRSEYSNLFMDALRFYQDKDRLELFSFCIMSNHVHLIFADKQQEPAILLRSLKTYTSKKIVEAIENNPQESRKEWILWMFERAASKTKNVKKRMFWQHHNQPIELWSQDVILQKLNYIHNNPVKAGLVDEPEN